MRPETARERSTAATTDPGRPGPQRQVEIVGREPAAVDGAGTLQVDAPELRLVRRQVTQSAGDLASRLRQASLELEDLGPDESAVQADRDRIGVADRSHLVQQGIRLRRSVQVELELGRQQQGCPGLGREPVLGELVGQPGGVRQQPGRRSTDSQIRVQQDELGGPPPAVVAVPSEAVPRPSRQPTGVVAPTGEQGDLRPGQVDLAEVLPAPVPAEQLRGLGQAGVGLVGQPGGEQHAGPVEVGDALLRVTVQLQPLLHQAKRLRQVAGGELETAEVVQRDASRLVEMVLASECHRLPEITACSRHVPDLDEECPPVDEDTPLVDAGSSGIEALPRGRAAASLR